MTMVVVYVCIKTNNMEKANKRESREWEMMEKEKREHTTANALCLIELLTTFLG